LSAIGYTNGKKLITETVKTTDQPVSIQLNAQQPTIKADKEDISIITVAVNDRNNLQVPTANDEIQFSVSGPGKIIGVGNGDPTSLEPDKYIETITTSKITNLKEKAVPDLNSRNETAATVNDADWKPAFTDDHLHFLLIIKKQSLLCIIKISERNNLFILMGKKLPQILKKVIKKGTG